MKIVRSFIQGVDRSMRVTIAESEAEVRAAKRNHERSIRQFYGDDPELRHETIDPPAFTLRVGMTVKQAEQELIEQTVTACGGCITAAAALLGRSRRSVYDKVLAYQTRAA